MKQILFLLMLLCSICVYAQDVIVKKNGSTILCRIVEINSSEVIYKKWTNLKGANYVMNRTDITAINYENGKKDLLSESGINQYTPGNQNTGQQQMNDNALLRMYYENQKSLNKVKKLKKTGYIGGGILVGIGLALIISPDIIHNDTTYGTYAGYGCVVAGGIWTGAFLYSAKRCQKTIDPMVLNTPILQNEFKLKTGDSLMTSMDLLKDNICQTNTIGLAFRYIF